MGTYRCNVAYGSDTETLTKDVFVRPTVFELTATVPDPSKMADGNVVILDQAVTLVADIAGDAIKDPEWYRDGAKKDSVNDGADYTWPTATVNTFNTIHTMVIPAKEDNSQGDIYRFKASYKADETYIRPPDFTLTTLGIATLDVAATKLKKGSSVVFTCNYYERTGPESATPATWVVPGNTPLEAAALVGVHTALQSVLTIASLDYDNSGDVGCTVTYAGFTDTSTISHARTEELFVRGAEWMGGLTVDGVRGVYVLPGDPVTLECQFHGDELEIPVTWQLDDGDVNHAAEARYTGTVGQYGSYVSSVTLAITAVETADGGDWKCQGQYSGDASKTFTTQTLHILGKCLFDSSAFLSLF